MIIETEKATTIINEIKKQNKPTTYETANLSSHYLSNSFTKFVEKAYRKVDEELNFLDSYLFLFVDFPFNFISRIKQGLFSKKSLQWLTDDFLANEIKTKIPYAKQVNEFLKNKSWIELLFKYNIICLFWSFKKNIQHKITIYIVSVTYEISINKIKELMENINIRKDTITNLKVAQDLLSDLINLTQQLLILENQWKMESKSKYLMKNYVINELNNKSTDSDLRKLILFAFRLKEDLKEDFKWEQAEGLQKNITILRGETEKFSIFFKPSEQGKK